LEILFPVWLVVLTLRFLTLLCLHSLTHHSTLGQDRIGMHLMITPRRIITRRQGLKLLWAPIILFLDDCLQKGRRIGIKASRSIYEGPRSRKKNFLSLCMRLVFFPFCLPQIDQTGMCDRSRTSFHLLVYNISLLSSLDLRKYCNMCYWMFIYA
jgi:hypothetical protein